MVTGSDRVQDVAGEDVRRSEAGLPASREAGRDGGRQTRRFQEKREAILGAAARLFNQNGVKGGTLADVAQSVGLITNSVTYYYRKKEDLAKACYLRSIAVLDEIAGEAAGEADPQARIAHFITAYFEVVRRIATGEQPELMHFHDLRALPPSHSEEVFAAYTNMFRRVRDLVAGAQGEKLSRLQANARAHLLLSQSLWARTWARRYAPEDYSLAARRACDILIHGIGSARSRWDESILPNLLRAPDSGSGREEDATPEDFLRAATQLVNEHGYRGASVDKISAMLHVTKGSFYHHHDNKEDLIVACFEHTFEIMRQVFIEADAATGSGWDRLGLAARTLIAIQFSGQGPLLRHSAWSVLPADLRYDKRRTMNRLAERLAGFIVDGIADGTIRPVDQVVAAQLVIGMVNASTELSNWAPGVNPENAADLFAWPLFAGILARPPQPR